MRNWTDVNRGMAEKLITELDKLILAFKNKMNSLPQILGKSIGKQLGSLPKPLQINHIPYQNPLEIN